MFLAIGVQAQKQGFKLKALYALSGGSRVESMSLSSARVKLDVALPRERALRVVVCSRVRPLTVVPGASSVRQTTQKGSVQVE